MRYSRCASHPLSRSSGAASSEAATGIAANVLKVFAAPKVCPAQESHVRRPGWTELFFDLVFAAAIAQLSAPLGHDYSVYGIGRFAFLLALVFLAWFGYTSFSTQFGVDDIVERVLIVAQIFLVAVMAANATDALSSKDAAGFGAAYGGVRAILAVQYARVVRSHNAGPFVRRRIIGLLVSAIFWTLSALFLPSGRYIGWTLALLLDIGNSWPPLHTTTASPPGATHSGAIRAAHNHLVRRICRFCNARDRNPNGLEFSRCVRCRAEPWFGSCNLVVLFRRRDGVGNAARAQSEGCGAIT